MADKQRPGRTFLGGLAEAANTASGWRGFSNLVGAGQMLMQHGLPSGVMLGPDGQLVFKTKSPDAQAYGSDLAVVPETTTAEELPAVLVHEGRHNLQDRVLGPGMIFAKPAEALSEYGHGPLEGDAYRHEQPTGEFARKGPKGAYSRAGAALLRGLLGD